MQFGRIDHNAYTLDFQYPFSAVQAFAVALANVTQRLKWTVWPSDWDQKAPEKFQKRATILPLEINTNWRIPAAVCHHLLKKIDVNLCQISCPILLLGCFQCNVRFVWNRYSHKQ